MRYRNLGLGSVSASSQSVSEVYLGPFLVRSEFQILYYIYIFIDARRPAFLGVFLYFTYIRYIEGHGCTLPDQNTLYEYDTSRAQNTTQKKFIEQAKNL